MLKIGPAMTVQFWTGVDKRENARQLWIPGQYGTMSLGEDERRLGYVTIVGRLLRGKTSFLRTLAQAGGVHSLERTHQPSLKAVDRTADDWAECTRRWHHRDRDR